MKKRNSAPRASTRKKPQSSTKNIEIIVNCASRETRIAVLENAKLMEYRVEREERVVGSIFKGIVQNVLPGMDAAFVASPRASRSLADMSCSCQKATTWE